MKLFSEKVQILLTSLAIVLVALWLSGTIELYTLLSLTVFLVMGLLSLSLAFIWGYGGILCFGQAALHLRDLRHQLGRFDLGSFDGGAVAHAVLIAARLCDFLWWRQRCLPWRNHPGGEFGAV
jgi:hypothetical protein